MAFLRQCSAAEPQAEQAVQADIDNGHGESERSAGFRRAQKAGRDNRERIEQRRQYREQGRRLDRPAVGLGHDEDTDEPGGDGEPTAQAHLFAARE